MARSRLHCLIWAITVCVASAVTSRDRDRAHQLVPRARYRSTVLIAANLQLNKHLATHDGISLVACEQFSTIRLRKVLHYLYAHASPELKAIYPSADGRTAQYKSVAQMEAAWELLPTNDTRVRDAHCHEAVMWYIHHLSTAEQTRCAVPLRVCLTHSLTLRASLTPLLVCLTHSVWCASLTLYHTLTRCVRARMLVQLPSLPMADHSVATRAAGDATGKFYDSKVTCQDCHIAGAVGSSSTAE